MGRLASGQRSSSHQVQSSPSVIVESDGSGSRPNRDRSAWRSRSTARRRASVFVVALVATLRRRPVASLKLAYQVPRFS